MGRGNYLKNKVAIITGSTRGIGYHLANFLADEGANVIINSRNQEDCNKVAAEIEEKTQNRTFAVESDVTDHNSVESLVKKSLEKFGKIDILVNNAGTAITKDAEDITIEEWDRIIDTNLKGVFLCSKIAAAAMKERKKGNIINISSIFGGVAEKKISPYCASKGGVNQLTKALALEWAKYNIKVNAICPGYIKTEMNEKIFENEKFRKYILNNIPERRLGKPEDLRELIVLLALDESDYINGALLTVDGGWTVS